MKKILPSLNIIGNLIHLQQKMSKTIGCCAKAQQFNDLLDFKTIFNYLTKNFFANILKKKTNLKSLKDSIDFNLIEKVFDKNGRSKATFILLYNNHHFKNDSFKFK